MPLLLTREEVEEVARELAVSTKTVDRLITKGHFKMTRRIGKLIRIPFTEVQQFVKKDTPPL